MPNQAERPNVPTRIHAAVETAAATFFPGDGGAFAGFAQAALSQWRPGMLGTISAADVARALAECWRQVVASAADGPHVLVAPEDDGAVITTVMPDQPFIVDTVRKALRDLGAQHISGFNVVVRLTREGGVRPAGEGEGRPESVIRFHFTGIGADRLAAVADDVRARLALARASVSDFETMVARTEAAADAAFDVHGEEGIEAAEFLRWLLSDNFVFIGLSRFHADGVERLGADRLAGPIWPLVEATSGEGVVQVRKDNVDAPIHRHGRIDVVRVNLASGQVVIRGMFTHRALTQPCRHLPILRRRLAAVLAETRSRPNSYRYRGLANVFDSMPTEWLFSASVDQVREVIELVFEADQDQEARVHVTQLDGGSTTFTIIALPERSYSDALRKRILDYLVPLTGGATTDSGLFAGRFDSVLLQVYQTGTRPLSDLDLEALRRFVAEASRPWFDRISTHLAAAFDDEAPAMVTRYQDAFTAEYVDFTPGEMVARDIRYLERSRATGQVLAHVCEQAGDVLLRVYATQEVLLTDLMPIIDHFGLVVSDQNAVPVRPRGLEAQHLAVFRIARVDGIDTGTLLARSEALVEGLQAVFQKHIASDPFNRLLLRAGLTWQEVDLVRAYVGYARQLGLKQSIPRTQEILLNQADGVAALVRLFHAKFDPDLATDRAAAIAVAQGTVADALLRIRTADEDTVMRTLANLVDATLRTNFYRTDRVHHYISFKTEHAKIKQIPLPRMMYEIYVHHREVEGVHLRGGPIARGGLRYSDRADFRTEVLGLVTTQMVKNVVIVPEGSKGGFYVKYTIDDPAERRRKGDEVYQIFIRGLLDITDNIVAGEVVRPPRVVAHDGNDPYLVVAADKGTAHLSDTANRLSKAYGFWLGDAFASGGSNGYDHKAVGITARGGWVLVKRHFREMGMDADRDLFTCVGIGDPSGDVFGNGVIETPKMRLLAAFNHAHIFLDPNPDAERTYAERRRLFDAVKGWEGYDRSLLSEGGGIFDRKAKSIPLSPQVREMLGTLETELSPDQVINLILKMPVDLLWNGGIGTYVRASWETNADANDPPNDAVRIHAGELRCKIIGEGGNLGLTQAARIEYALAGGRLNTDFVDNSGGVDTSDHEVNLKILLNPMVASGRITETERNDLLRSLTDEVAQSVLANNNANGRLISLDVVRSARDPNPYSRAIDWVCHRGNVTRRFLVLPTDDDLKRRAQSRVGLTRPELATLQAHVKMHLFKMLMQEDPAQIPGFDDVLMGYFPKAVQDRYRNDIPKHMLAKAIGMTVLLTEVATDAGAAFFPMMMELTGASPARIAGAWRQAMSLVGGEDMKARLVAARAQPQGAHYAWTQFTDGLEMLVSSWLAPGSPGWAAEDRTTFGEALAAVASTRSTLDVQAARNHVVAYTSRGVPADLAESIVTAADAAVASEVCAVARARKESVRDAALRYQAVGNASKILSTIRGIATRRGEGRWDPVARGILRLRLQGLLRELVTTVEVPPAQLALGVDRCAEALAGGELAPVAQLVDQIVGESPEVSAVLVAEQQIRAAMAR